MVLCLKSLILLSLQHTTARGLFQKVNILCWEIIEMIREIPISGDFCPVKILLLKPFGYTCLWIILEKLMMVIFHHEVPCKRTLPNTACTRTPATPAPSSRGRVRRGRGGGTAARRDGVRVFRQFSWLEVGSGKGAFSRPTHQPH